MTAVLRGAGRTVVSSSLGQTKRHSSSFSLKSLGSLFGGRPTVSRAEQRREEQERQRERELSGEDDVTPLSRMLEQREKEQRSLFDSLPQSLDPSTSTSTTTTTMTRTKATYHKSSTANFKTSPKKLNELARLVAGKTADEGILQLQMSRKKQSGRLLSMLALARNHAIAKGMERSKLVIAQSWVTKGKFLPRLDIKGRGRFGMKHHPSAKMHVLLAEGKTEQERRRMHEREKYRKRIRGQAEPLGSAGVGKTRPLINTPVAGWRW